MPAFRTSLRVLAACLALILPAMAAAQPVPANDPLPVETQLTLHMRDLEQTWDVMQGRGAQSPQAPASAQSLPDDETLRARLQAIQGEFQFDLYPRVRAFLEFFTQRQASSFEAVLGMTQLHKPFIERSLAQRKMPPQLLYLPVALSAMNVCAVSEHGTAGLWQLNYHTAIRYGLHCSELVDERRDLHRSTTAALQYLGDLRKQHGSWLLAVTAFTNGPSALTRAKQRSGGQTDFQQLYPHLPTPARDYVPAFIAACYLALHAKDLGLRELSISRTAAPDRIQLQQPLGFKSVAKVLAIPEEQLRTLNPVCRMEYIPGLNVPVQLCLPAGYGARFTALRDSVYAVQAALDKAAEASAPAPMPEPGDEPESSGDDPAEGGAVRPGDEEKANAYTPPPGTVPISYTIQPGDNLGKIAQDHGLTISQVKAANNLRSDNIRAGDRLTLHVPKAKAPQLSAPRLPSPEKAPAPKAGTAPKATTAPAPQGAPAFTWYTVRSGDNLWAIARRHPGVTEQDIMKLNGISEKLQPGQKIKIPQRK